MTLTTLEYALIATVIAFIVCFVFFSLVELFKLIFGKSISGEDVKNEMINGRLILRTYEKNDVMYVSLTDIHTGKETILAEYEKEEGWELD